jgi:predicted transcriptional regulator
MMSDSDNRYTQSHRDEPTTDTDNPIEGETSSDGTMHLTVGGSDYERILDTLAAVDRGETPEPYYSRSFESLEELHRALAPTNLTLLRVIVRKQPESIRATARAVDRDVKEVHRNLNELEQLGLIEFDETGRAKRPTVWYNRVSVDLDLGDEQSALDRIESVSSDK